MSTPPDVLPWSVSCYLDAVIKSIAGSVLRLDLVDHIDGGSGIGAEIRKVKYPARWNYVLSSSCCSDTNLGMVLSSRWKEQRRDDAFLHCSNHPRDFSI